MNDLHSAVLLRPKPIIVREIVKLPLKRPSNPMSFGANFSLCGEQSSCPEIFTSVKETRTQVIRELDNLKYLVKKRAIYDEYTKQYFAHLIQTERQTWEAKIIQQDESDVVWIYTNEGGVYMKGSEAEATLWEMSPKPRFITNPLRFDINKGQVSELKTYISREVRFYRSENPVKEHIDYKTKHIWTLEQIGRFVEAFFKTPKKFEEIKKALPEKSIKDIIQFFYLYKYPLRLKSYVRTQTHVCKSRDLREGVIKSHVTEIMNRVSKIMKTTQEYKERSKRFSTVFFSHSDLEILNEHTDKVAVTYITPDCPIYPSVRLFSELLPEERFKKTVHYYHLYGKDETKISHSVKAYRDYGKYKEYAYGGDRVQDEWPQEESNVRRGTNQWTFDEKMKFIELFRQYGRNWEVISSKINTKTLSQVKNFFQNYKKKLNLENLEPNHDPETILKQAGISKN
jgi:hypothetical protein